MAKKTKSSQPPAALPAGYLVVSKLVAEGKQPIGFIYRESPADVDDSGWRIFSGNEDEGFGDQMENFLLLDAPALLALDRSVAAILPGPVGAAFERAASNKPFREIEFDPEKDE